MEQINILVDILQGVRDLELYFNEFKDEIKKTNALAVDAYESEYIDKISEAFAQAQMEYESISKNCEIGGKAYSFQYASLDQILNTIRPALTKYGLSFSQFTKESPDNSIIMLHTRLRHSSGQWIESRMRVFANGDKIQDLGSALTYYRRYSALMLLGHHPAEEDTDGSSTTLDIDARKRNVEKFVSEPIKTVAPQPKGYERITKREVEDLEEELKTYPPDMAERMMLKLGIRTLADMAQEDYRHVRDTIRKHKLELSTASK
jgi:hypothetical protein